MSAKTSAYEIVQGYGAKLTLLGAWSDQPFSPGSSFSFTWELTSYHSVIQLDKVYGELFLNGQLIYTTPTVPYVAAKGGGGTGLQFETVPPLQDPALRSALYKLRTHTLQFRATVSGPDANHGPFNTDLTVDTEPPSPADLSTWWDMDLAPDQINYVGYHCVIPVDWGSKFAVKASLKNQGMAAITCSFTVGMVNQNDANDSSMSQLLQFPFQIQPGQTGNAVLKPVQIAWIWFLPVTFIPIGPYDKSYDFSIVANITDEFGNAYPQVSIMPKGFFQLLCIDVAVQLWKKDLDLSASVLFATGAVLVFFPLAGLCGRSGPHNGCRRGPTRARPGLSQESRRPASGDSQGPFRPAAPRAVCGRFRFHRPHHGHAGGPERHPRPAAGGAR